MCEKYKFVDCFCLVGSELLVVAMHYVQIQCKGHTPLQWPLLQVLAGLLCMFYVC